MLNPLATRNASAAILLLIAVSSVRGDESAVAADLIAKKSLTKVGSLYEIDVDVHLAERLRDIHVADAQLQAYSRQRESIQADIARSSSTLDGLQEQLAEVDEKMKANGRKAFASHNELVQQQHDLIRQVTEGQRYLKQRDEDLEKLPSPSAPVGQTIALANDVEAAAAQYTALAGDPDVKKILDMLSAAGPRVRLGPSTLFVQQLPLLRRARDVDMKLAVKGKLYHNTLQVFTTINGTSSVPMIVDSGSSVVLLTSNLAAQAGIKLKAAGSMVTIQTASGAQVKAQQGVISSLTVGPYTAHEVPCAVLPSKYGDQDCLLGTTFLQHFLYQVDLNAAELRLTPIGNDVATGVSPVTPPAATMPSPAPPASSPSVASTQPVASPAEFDVTIHATIDSRNEFVVNHDGIQLLQSPGQLPVDVNVNDLAWDVTAAKSLPSSQTLEPLSHIDFASVRTVTQSGRGKFTVSTADDGIHIVIVDGHRGAGLHTITLAFHVQ